MGKVLLQRYEKNPVLIPNEANWWESKAVFNCAILHYENKFHMLYRAIGEYERYISRIGYASSADGYSFATSKNIALEETEDYEKYGIEDPRIVKIDNQIYITYVVLSGYVTNKPMVEASTALATTTDFLKYTRLGVITSKGSDNKDVVLFPEKINQQESSAISLSSASTTTIDSAGKYFFLHRPSSWIGSRYGVDKPSIWLGEGNALTNFEKHTLLLKPEEDWEQLKVGAGPPPIRTRAGWLIIYHGVSRERVYRAGAAILDIRDPSKILGRTKTPILEPKEPYEKFGDVNNVVFPTGACVVDNDKLFIYYGGADKVCCLATADLNYLLDHILKCE
ncbi:MAG: glycosidase [Thermoproteota archaeon]|nr:glycosidase [Thermoproteota archaeon]